MKPLRCVLHILETDQFAGTEAHVITLMQAFNPAHTQSALLCRRDSPLHQRALNEGLSCHTGSSLVSLIRLLRKGRFDLVHAHDGSAKIKAVMAATLGGTQVRVVATQHFIQPAYTLRTGWKKTLSTFAHQKINRAVSTTIAVSEAVRTAALARHEVSPDKITVIPNGIRFPMPAGDEEISKKLRACGVPEKVPLVCTVARLAAEKGIRYLLQAIPKVLQALPETHFLLVGDGPERDELQKEAQAQGLDSHVLFTGFRADAVDLLAGSTVFVLPSPAEPFGIAIIEAMALAKPVVATRAGGPLEIVQDGETGLLAAPANPDALAACLKILLTDSARAVCLGLAGQQRASALYSAATMALRTEAVYAAL